MNEAQNQSFPRCDNTSGNGCIVNEDHQHSSSTGEGVYVSIGVFMIFVCIFGCSENITVLYTYATSETLRTYRNAFLVGLALSDLGQAVLNIPFVAISAFRREWVFGEHVCQYYGFITSMFGLTQITILSSIALDRYFLIIHQKRVFSNSRKSSICTIVSCYVHGALWSLGPLLGWSRYIIDAGDISCGIDWNLIEDANLSFVLSLFICVWFLPLGVIVYSYTCIVRMLFKEKRKKTFLKGKKGKKASKERKVAVTCLIMTGFFVITWMPYSVVSLWAALDDIKNIPELAQMSTAFFAKSSIIWNPLIYFIRHDHFRSACATSLPCLRRFLKVKSENSDESKKTNVTNSTDTPLKSRLIVRGPALEKQLLQMNIPTRETNI